MTKILIADDHQLVNDGVKNILSPYFDIIAQVFHGKNVIPEIVRTQPSIIILDINLPEITGLVLGKEIKRMYPEKKIVFLSMYNEIRFVNAAKGIGAEGYLSKDVDNSEIILALQTVEKGGTHFIDVSTQQTPNLHHDDYFVKQFSLSKREVEVICLIRQGFSSEEISKKLFIGFETVKSHRKNIFLKLNIAKVSELIQFAIKHGI